MQQPQGVQEQDWEVFQANKNPHLDMQVGIPMPREFPIAAIFLAAVQAHSLGTLFHKPTVKPLAPHSCLPVRDPSSGPGKHCHQPPASSPAAPGTCAQEFSVSSWEHGPEKRALPNGYPPTSKWRIQTGKFLGPSSGHHLLLACS